MLLLLLLLALIVTARDTPSTVAAPARLTGELLDLVAETRGRGGALYALKVDCCSCTCCCICSWEPC